ncbi:MAG: hypothetical protein JXA60_03990 [Candidatus Coatesbacteria bacterium]|nr:hypothetical protein [Candidatus Coatesbacteria bacterium]
MKLLHIYLIAICLFIASCGQSKKTPDKKIDYDSISKSVRKYELTENSVKENLKPLLIEHTKEVHKIYKKYNDESHLHGYMKIYLKIASKGNIDKVVIQSDIQNNEFLKEVEKYYYNIKFQPTGLDTAITVHFTNNFEK